VSATRLIAAALLCACSCACTTQTRHDAATAEFVAAQKSTARDLQARGDLAAALAVWRSLKPLGRPDAETRAAKAQLEREIESRTGELRARGKRAYLAGNSGEGDHYMLRVLALRPGDEEALQYLGKSFSARAGAQQQSRRAQETRATGKPVAAEPYGVQRQLEILHARGDYAGMLALEAQVDAQAEPGAAALLRSAHTRAADRAEQGGRYEEALHHMQAAMVLRPLPEDPLVARSSALRNELSMTWYRDGSRLLNSDLDAAIAALEKSLSFNPYNERARRKLDQARTLQRNLSRIEQGR